MVMRLLLILLPAAFAAGCANADLPKLADDEISHQWAGNLRKLGFQRAVYPPTEEIQVGDIAVFDHRPVDPNHPDDPRPIVRVDRIDLGKALQAAYETRLMMPETGNTDANKGFRPQSGKAGGIFAATPAESDRLPIAALPAYTLASVNARKAGVAIPLRFFNIGAAASSQASATVSLRVVDVETYGLPAIHALEEFGNYCDHKRASPAKAFERPCSAETAYEVLDAMKGVRTCDTGVTLVSRVWLTRRIDYVIESEQGFSVGAELAVRLSKALTAQQALADLIAKQKPPPAASGSGPAKQDQTAQERAVADLAAMNAELAKDLRALQETVVPGGSLQLSDVRTASITLSQTFERPVVFAWEGPTWITDNDAKCRADHPGA